ncbi:hypothetical protein M5D96_003967 [Drosophila gunungcola]|uniref:Uncharacterized protein n=1 Tax=Drosophila gunungcola TaxID=103775 RepID=A0A9Q0BSL0_9MUSC|nr:hypothetical protein M5D96_003967 [Drosophila gunungcola]
MSHRTLRTQRSGMEPTESHSVESGLAISNHFSRVSSIVHRPPSAAVAMLLSFPRRNLIPKID